MGFHIITYNQELGLKYSYVSCYDDIANVSNITKDSLVYEADEGWKPITIGASDKYKDFVNDWYRAGIKAQEIFRRQAQEEGLLIEEINQGQKNFKQYCDCANPEKVKRGDFIIRNASNVEIDVKCRSFWIDGKGNDRERFFDFKKSELQKHLNMAKQTGSPVMLAVYQREGDGLKNEKLYMIEIEKINDRIAEIATVIREDVGECLRVPIAMTKSNFLLLNKYRNKK